MLKEHLYTANIQWTGNQGEGTKNYKAYSRDYTVSVSGKYATIQGTSDPSFLGDPSRYTPEDLFLSSIASCHMLWYLHLCSTNNIVVTSYEDQASGSMVEDEKGSGKFVGVTLNPKVVIADKSMLDKAYSLHQIANKMCFIANSCNFKIDHKASVTVV